MTSQDQINAEIAVVEELAAYRDMLKHVEAGKPPEAGFTADELRRIVAALEAKVTSFLQEAPHA